MTYKFSVYDKVWVMEYNMPTEKVVFSVIETMTWHGKATYVSYELINGRYAANTQIDKPCLLASSSVFKSKEQLIKSLG